MKKYIISLLLSAILFPTAAFAQSEIFGEKINVDFTQKIQPDLLKQAADPKTTPFDFMLICKRLGVYGDKTAAPVVAAFLNDPAKAHSACTALQAMPFDEALQELRAAIAKTTNPAQKAGIFNALGMRRDRNAVKILLPFLTDKDQILANSAMFALARIADVSCMNAMLAKLDVKDLEKKENLNQAKKCFDLTLMYAEYLRRNGQIDATEKVFFAVAEKAPLKFYKESAYYQILLRDSDSTRKLMADWINGSDSLKYRSCLRAAQFVKNDAVTKILAAAYQKADAGRKCALLAALGDQRNPNAQQTLLGALGSEDELIKEAAVRAMKSFADKTYFNELVKSAIEGDENIHKGSVAVIELLDDEVNPSIIKLLKGNDAQKALAVELIGLRKITAGQAEVFALAQSGSPMVKIAAVKALGEMADTEQFQWLVKEFVSAEGKDLQEAIKAGLKTACGQILDRDAAASALASGTNALKGKKDPRTIALFEMFAVLGGSAARNQVAQAAVADDVEFRDLATRVLGTWMDPDVAPILLKLANAPGYQYANRALRGYLRLARQFAMPKWMRCAMVRDAMASPTFRDKEKEIAAIIVKQYDLDLKSKETADQKALRNIEIQKAIYGVLNDPAKQKDVTDKVREAFLNAGKTTVQIEGGFNKAFGGDPAPGVPKQIRIQFLLRDTNQTKTVDLRENSILKLK